MIWCGVWMWVHESFFFLLVGVSGWMFLLVPAHPGSPGQRDHSTVVCVCVHLTECQRNRWASKWERLTVGWRVHPLCSRWIACGCRRSSWAVYSRQAPRRSTAVTPLVCSAGEHHALCWWPPSQSHQCPTADFTDTHTHGHQDICSHRKIPSRTSASQNYPQTKPTNKVKVAHTPLMTVRFWSWSRFLAVSLQVTWVINPAVGCHYFLPGLQLRSQPLRGLLPISLLGEKRHNGCEQFA